MRNSSLVDETDTCIYDSWENLRPFAIITDYSHLESEKLFWVHGALDDLVQTLAQVAC